MMKPNPLQETNNLQQLASNPKNSAWVFASAGSGKTKILVDRVLRLLLEDVRPDKILCLTFTKVAALEMQNRISSRLADWVLLSDSKLDQNITQLTGKASNSTTIKKARTLFAKILDEESKIKIQTIHSFCQNLVKIFPFEAGIRPNFEVIEDSQEKLLLQKSQREVLKNAENDKNLRDLVTKINSKLHEATFSELVLDLLKKKEQLSILKENLFGIESVIDEIFKNFEISRNSTEENIFAEFTSQINQRAVMNLSDAMENSGLKNNSKNATQIKNFLQNPDLKNFSSYHQAFFTKENTARVINGKILDDIELADIFNEQLILIGDFLDRLNSHKICNSTSLLLKFVDQILEIYSDLKQQNSLLDYNDLIIETNRLLNNPNFSDWVKLKMDGLFDHILIDESQDTNHQQWNIIKSLTEDFFSGLGATNKDRTIFIVGDEKQSIYSFQGAEPNISQDIFSYFSDKLQDHPSKLLKINLDASFRSLETILHVVDETFKEEKYKAAIAKISDFKGHSAIRNGIGKCEIWPQIKAKKEEKKPVSYQWNINFSEQENYQEQEFLSEFIALKIKSLVDSKYILEGHIKPVNYGDFIILLRNRTNGLDKNLSRFFHKYDIPHSSSSKVKFSDNIIIQDLLAAAKFALFCHDDLNLACLLKSPIFAISEEDLLEICLFRNNNESTIYAALEHLNKFSEIKSKLDNLINNSQNLNCFDFFNTLINEDNSTKKILSRFGSENAQILDKFLLKVFDFSQNFSNDLQRFLDFIEKLNPELSLSNNQDNQVLISTIHSAKGLQAPIVIIPDCCFNFNQLPASKERISWLEFDDIKLPIWCSKKDEENKLLKQHRQERNQAAKDEYLRLLYVAMTRAENELYIAGYGASNDEDSWYNLIKKSISEQAWEKEFLNENIKDLARDKFEIGNILGIGKQDSHFDNHQEYDKQNQIQNDAPEKDNLVVTANIANQKPKIRSATKAVTNQINHSQILGKMIHKVLEVIGKNYKEDKSWLINLSKKIVDNTEFLDKESKRKALEVIHNFLLSEQFANIFSGEVRCEAPIIGKIDGQMINARIDLLTINKNQILIIDYKSNKSASNKMSAQYLKQLETYEQLIKNIYPNHLVRSAVLWLESLELDFKQ